LHRDVSIGNILMVEEPFESKRGFSIDVEELLRDTTPESPEAAHSSDPLAEKKSELTKRIREDAKSIGELILQNSLSGNRARAFIMDFDISASWIGYFNADHSAGSISVCHFVEVVFAADSGFHQGTLPFMSDDSVAALKHGRSYQQSPVDDIESFLWVLLYSIVQNSTSPHSDLDNELRDAFDTPGRAMALRMFNNVRTTKAYCELTRTLSASGLLRAYEAAIYTLRGQWEDDLEALDDAKSCDARAWELCYHAAAIRGLLAVLQILVDFRARNNQTTQ